jgi:uncharacterized OB-fold protein
MTSALDEDGSRASTIRGGIGADERYWEALEEGRFVLPRCSGCQRWMWPAHFRCGVCGSWDVDWQDVEPVGSVYSFTRTWYSFDRVRERADQVPYVVVLAEIPAAGNSRVLGVLKGDETGLASGAAVHGEIDPPSLLTKGYATIRWVLGR